MAIKDTRDGRRSNRSHLVFGRMAELSGRSIIIEHEEKNGFRQNLRLQQHFSRFPVGYYTLENRPAFRDDIHTFNLGRPLRCFIDAHLPQLTLINCASLAYFE